MTQLLRRLRERKLAQWGLAYLAAAWVLLQVLDLVGHQFDWPAGLLRGITVALGVGFFATLVLAFYHGERGAQTISGAELLILASLLAIGGARSTEGSTRSVAIRDSRTWSSASFRRKRE